MLLRIITSVLLVIAVISCSYGPKKTKIVKLSSGTTIETIGIRKNYFGNGDSLLMFEFITKHDIEEVDSLRCEAEEIWPIFRNNANELGFKNAAIKASEIAKGGMIKTWKSFTFVIEQDRFGQWIPHSWGRDYSFESERLSEEQIRFMQESNNSMVASKFCLPPDYSIAAIDKERESLTMIFDCITENIGRISSFKLCAERSDCTVISLCGAEPEYWRIHPYFISRSYEICTVNSDVFQFSFKYTMTEDSLSLSVFELGIPANCKNGEVKFSSIYKRITSILSKT